MLIRLVDQSSKRAGHTDTVISAESRLIAFGMHPLTVYFRLNRVGLEIMRFGFCLVRHHVHMSLQNHHRCIFLTRSGRHTHRDIADSVGFCFYVVPFGKIEEEFTDLSFLFRRTRNLGYLVKNTPNEFRFKFFDSHRCLQF